MGERGAVVPLLWRERLDVVAGETRQVVGGALERAEGRAQGLVGKRDDDIRASGERLEQPPLRAREILEPVGEDRLRAPGAELARDQVGGARACQLAVPELEAVELRPVAPVQIGELPVQVAGLEQRGFKVGDGGPERVGKPRVARRRSEPVQAGRGNDTGEQKRPLRIGDLRARGSARVLPDAPEKVVERPDRPAKKGGATRQQIVLDPVDVRPVRNNQKRVSVEGFEIAIEQTRDFARVRGAHQESQRHLLDSRRLPGGPRPPGSALVEPVFGEKSLRGGLRPAAAASGGPARHLARAVVAEIRGLGAPARVRVRHPHSGALALADFLAAVVAHENGFSSQCSSRDRCSAVRMLAKSVRYSSADISAPRTASVPPGLFET